LRSQQVEIEAKFVEFNEGALEELGFDWNVYGSKINSELSMADGDAQGLQVFRYDDYISDDPNSWQWYLGDGTPVTTPDPVNGNPNPDGRQIFPDTVEGYKVFDSPSGGQNLFGSYQRNNQTAFDAVQLGILNTMGGNPASMLFSNGEDGGVFDLTITAMEQEGTADVLSAPKVTTKSGAEAVIKVGEFHRYPQDWQVDSGQRTTPALSPQDWEDIYLGVELRVTPLVDTENNTIDLQLKPDIKKLKGLDRYIATATLTGNPDTGQNINKPLEVTMPYYESKTVETQVTIADGQTVVMGGLVDERTETFRDQVPVLGDVPLLGRFFRTEGTRTSKQTLTIFVKATQVDERGLNRRQRDAVREMASN